MKTRKLIKTLKLVVILLTSTIMMQAQKGVMQFPEDDEPPIGVTNWGLPEMTKAACAAGEIFVEDDAYWDLGYSGDWICKILPCPPEDEEPKPDPNPPTADTSGTGGGNGGGNSGGGTPPSDDKDDDEKDKDEKSTSTGIINKYIKSGKVASAIAFKIKPSEKETVKAYMKSRASMTNWKQEGFFYTHYKKSKVNGKNKFYFYVADGRPNKRKPAPTLQYRVEMHQGTIYFVPTFVKNNNLNLKKKNQNRNNSGQRKKGKKQNNKRR